MGKHDDIAQLKLCRFAAAELDPALAFEDQVVPTLPVGPSDMQVDMLVTDQKARRFGR